MQWRLGRVSSRGLSVRALLPTDESLWNGLHTADHQQKLLKLEENESPNRAKRSKRVRKPIQKKILYLGLILTTEDTHTHLLKKKNSLLPFFKTFFSLLAQEGKNKPKMMG